MKAMLTAYMSNERKKLHEAEFLGIEEFPTIPRKGEIIILDENSYYEVDEVTYHLHANNKFSIGLLITKIPDELIEKYNPSIIND